MAAGTLARVTDPDIDNTELEALECDLATIEAAMDRVDSGDLEGAESAMACLTDVESDATVQNPA